MERQRDRKVDRYTVEVERYRCREIERQRFIEIERKRERVMENQR